MVSSRLFTLNRALINKDYLSKIHALWFADQPLSAPTPTPDSIKRWFFNPDKAAAKAFDEQCRTLCAPALDSLSPTHVKLPAFTDWKTEHAQTSTLSQPFWDLIEDGHPLSARTDEAELDAASRDALALFILVDQMPRNIFRADQKVIYAHYDRLGQALARSMLGAHAGAIPRLDLAPWIKDRLVMRQWFYLPLMHSEDLDSDHALLKNLFDGMRKEKVDNGDEEGVKVMDGNLDYEKRHADILVKFGRYPYRNKALGRQSSEAEDEYERSGGEKFTA